MNKLLTEESQHKNLLQVSGDSEKFVIPMDWYLRYVRYKKGGDHPGKIILSHLLSTSQSIDPQYQEGLDYRLVSSAQWSHFSKTFGVDHQIIITCRRPSFRSVSSGGYDDDTQRLAADLQKFPISARKSFEFSSEVSSEMTSKPTSIDQEMHQLKKFSINSKLTLASFNNSAAFNAVLQLLMSIEDLVEFISKLSSFGDCYNSEFLIQLSLVFLAAIHTHSGVIETEQFYQSFKFSYADPGQILQTLVNKLEIETCTSSSINMFLNGMINKEIQCLACGTVSSFDSKFTYLALKPSKSLKKSLELFSRHVTQTSFCSSCNKENDCYVLNKITQFPKYFVLVFKRWEEGFDKGVCKFYSKVKLGQDYRLAAVISQVNKEIVSFCKRSKNWMAYEGEDWKKVQISNVLANSPYVLLYKLAN